MIMKWLIDLLFLYYKGIFVNKITKSLLENKDLEMKKNIIKGFEDTNGNTGNGKNLFSSLLVKTKTTTKMLYFYWFFN